MAKKRYCLQVLMMPPKLHASINANTYMRPSCMQVIQKVRIYANHATSRASACARDLKWKTVCWIQRSKRRLVETEKQLLPLSPALRR
mmetsp:Transcript_138339/g.275749  ORF Transcript_138339/g.275749 Transcript_138339/m.275749 type:complete len:88 (-) Transcript_138339:157-420(-)